MGFSAWLEEQPKGKAIGRPEIQNWLSTVRPGSAPQHSLAIEPTPTALKPNEVKVYHGTSAPDFTTFDAQQSKYGGDLYFTSNPEMASYYGGGSEPYFLDQPGRSLPQGAARRVIPTTMDTTGFKAVNLKGMFKPYEFQSDSGGRLEAEIVKAKTEGYKGLIAKGISDQGTRADQYVTWTPNTVRSSITQDRMFASDPLGKLADGLTKLAQKFTAQPVKGRVPLDHTLPRKAAAAAARVILAEGKAVTIDPSVTNTVLEIVGRNAQSVPAGTKVGALVEIRPRSDGEFDAVFKLTDGGTRTERLLPQEVLNTRAFFSSFEGGTDSAVLFTHLDSESNSEGRVLGELGHEIIHALRRRSSFPAAEWTQLLNHANSLGILELDYRDFARGIKLSNWDKFPVGVTIGQIYRKQLGKGADKEVMNQEAVAHLYELHLNGALRGGVMQPVQAILDKIAAGAYQPKGGRRAGRAAAVEAQEPWVGYEEDKKYEAVPPIAVLLKQLKGDKPMPDGFDFLEALASPYWLQQLGITAEQVNADPVEALTVSVDEYEERYGMSAETTQQVETLIMMLQDIQEGVMGVEPEWEGDDSSIAQTMGKLLRTPVIDPGEDYDEDEGSEFQWTPPEPNAESQKVLSFPPSMFDAVMKWAGSSAAGIAKGGIQDIILNGAPVAALITLTKGLDPNFSEKAIFSLEGNKLDNLDVGALVEQMGMANPSKKVLDDYLDEKYANYGKDKSPEDSQLSIETIKGSDLINSDESAFSKLKDMGEHFLGTLQTVSKVTWKGNWLGNIVEYKPENGYTTEFMDITNSFSKFTKADLMGYVGMSPSLAEKVLEKAKKLPKPSAPKIVTLVELGEWIDSSIKDVYAKTSAKIIGGFLDGIDPVIPSLEKPPFWVKEYKQDKIWAQNPMHALANTVELYVKVNNPFPGPSQDALKAAAADMLEESSGYEKAEAKASILSKAKSLFTSGKKPAPTPAPSPAKLTAEQQKTAKLKAERLAAQEKKTAALNEFLPKLKAQLNLISWGIVTSLNNDKWLTKYAGEITDPFAQLAHTVSSYVAKNRKFFSSAILSELDYAVDTLKAGVNANEPAPKNGTAPATPVLPSYKTVSDAMKALTPGAKNHFAKIIKQLTEETAAEIKSLTTQEIQDQLSGPEWNKKVAETVLAYTEEKFTPHNDQLQDLAHGLLREYQLVAPEPTAKVDPQKRTYTFKGKGSGGSKPKEIWADEDGHEYMFKPVKPGDEFLAYGEAMGGQISKMLNPDAPDIFTMTLNKRLGSMQRYVSALGTLRDLGKDDVEALTAAQIAAIQREHVVDWMISNHDGHANQFLLMDDGRVIGIDKGQAFKYFGKDKLDTDYHPNEKYGEREPIYNTLWRAYKNGGLAKFREEIQVDEKAQVDGVKAAIDAQNKVIEDLKDQHEKYEQDVNDFEDKLQKDFNFIASSDQTLKQSEETRDNVFKDLSSSLVEGPLRADEFYIQTAESLGDVNDYRILSKSAEDAKAASNGYAWTNLHRVSIDLETPTPRDVFEKVVAQIIADLKPPMIPEDKQPENYDRLFLSPGLGKIAEEITTILGDMGYDHLPIEAWGRNYTLVFPSPGETKTLVNSSAYETKFKPKYESFNTGYDNNPPGADILAEEIAEAHWNVGSQLLKDYPEIQETWLKETPPSDLKERIAYRLRYIAEEIRHYKIDNIKDLQEQASYQIENLEKDASRFILKYLSAALAPVKPTRKTLEELRQKRREAEQDLDNLRTQHDAFRNQLKEALYREVTASITKLQDILSDSLYAGMIRPYAESRFKGDAVRVEAFIDFALQRKNNLATKFYNFFLELEGVRERARKAMAEYNSSNIKMDKYQRQTAESYNKTHGAEGKLLGDLTAAEYQAIHDYTNNAYGNINRRLYSEQPIKEGEANLEWMKGAEYAAIITSGLMKLKPYVGTVVRQESFKDSASQLDPLKVGQIFTNKAFWSSTRDVNHGSGSDLRYVIQSKTGRHVKDISGHPSEDEVLFAPGRTFLITNVLINNTGYSNRHEIYMVELDGVDFNELENYRE